MAKRIFTDLANSQFAAGKFVCVGLDSDISKIRKVFSSGTDWSNQLHFNKQIVEATHNVAGFYKLNSAFYESVKGGFEVMKQTVEFINSINPEIVVGVDAKRGDIGNTNEGYVSAFFDYCGFDFITVAPYMGIGSLKPFWIRSDKGVMIICLTSNEEASEFQELYTLNTYPAVKPDDLAYKEWFDIIKKSLTPLYLRVAYNVANNWNNNGNCGLVVGANKSEKGHAVREMVGESMIILSPAVGKQTEGQPMEEVITEALLSIGNLELSKVIFNNSRAIIFASSDPNDFALVAGQKAKEMHNVITSVRNKLLTSC